MHDHAEGRFRTALDRQLTWLKRDSLPRWANGGVDPRGGFFERIDQQGHPVLDLPRRARVVARQTYVFALATERGWGEYAALALHGVSEIIGRCLLDTGLSLSTYSRDGRPLGCEFDAYDQAFVLFALATIGRIQPEWRKEACVAGERLLIAMRDRFRHPVIGFEEAVPRRTPLLQNPHMHLLEACLAFDEVPGAPSIWRKQAHELIDLVKTRLADRTTGAIHEFFDGDWCPIIDEQGGWIEPGHQFEWAWLLWQWHDRVDDMKADAMAHRLFQIGTDHGIAVSGHVIDAIDVGHSPRARTLRLWPQTERLKACVAVAKRTHGAARSTALAGAAEAIDSLGPFLATPVAGLWYDRLTEGGEVVKDAAPASSLYHIVCALDYAERYALDYPPADC